jgi:hypothetical protein
VEPTYHFDDESYAALGRAGVPWQAAIHILRTHPQLIRHVDPYLIIAGPTADGSWYSIALLEQADDTYRVADGRPLTPEQTTTAQNRLHGRQP